MKSFAHSIRVAGIVTAVPAKVVQNHQFVDRFDPKSIADFVQMTGVHFRREADPEDNLFHYALPAVEQLIHKLGWSRDSISAVVVVTQTPVAPAPPTAVMVSSLLGLGDVAAFDVNLGCSGYPYGLWLMSKLLRSGVMDPARTRGLLIAGDLCSQYLNPKDRATAMLFGDAISVTALERDDNQPSRSTFVLGSDGSGANDLRIEKGPTLVMSGAEVFAFTLRSVPKLYDELTENRRLKPDLVVMHQANRMIVERLSRKLDVPAHCNVDRFGNTSAASLPLLLCDLGLGLRETTMYTAMLGFGIGWSWAGALLHLGPLHLEVIDV